MVCLKNKKIICFLVALLNIAAFCTTIYIFIDPAISQTTEDYIACGHDEHIHTDECYISYDSDYSGKILNCEIKGENGKISHMHDSFCYDESNKLICPLEEYVHIHDQSCLNENNEQICGIIVHQHSEQCFCNSAGIENPEDYKLLACSKTTHVHRENCFEMHTSETEIQSVKTPEDNSALSLMYSETDNEDIEVYSNENIVETYSLDTSNAIDIGVKNENPDEDGEYKYIDSITVSYQLDIDKWQQINESDTNLPINTDYRLEVTYKNIQIKELLEHDGKLKLEGVPSWLKPYNDDKVTLNNVPVGSIQAENGTLLITFDEGFMKKHENDKLETGEFSVRGSVDWNELENNVGEVHLPTIDMTIHFEDNIIQKYGQMSVSKSEPELVYDDSGKPYLKYVLTVKSSESKYTIPDVKVQDSFVHNSSFVKSYYGIPTASLSRSENGFYPYETSNANETAGSVAENETPKSMCWNIGNLLPNEERTLTYYAELDEYYIGSFGRGNIENTVNAFAGNIPKGSDSKEFMPRAEARIDKKYISSNIDDYGTGTATYEIDVTAPDYNSYDLINLRLHDYVDSRFDGFVKYPDKVEAKSNKDDVTTDITTQKPDGTSFNAVIPVLRPGEIITVTYTVSFENIFALETGNVDFNNTAELFSEENGNRGEVSGLNFGCSQNYHTFQQSQWVRKLDGGNLKEDIVVSMDSNDKAYQFEDSVISITEHPDSFNVPKDSKKYQIVLNEKGLWDLSSATLEDKFQNTSITYTGWLCIQEFEDSGVKSSCTDTEVLNAIDKQTPSKTVWLNIDGRNEFKFTPSDDLKLSQKYTYLMTYYATLEDLTNTGKVMITNDFTVYGTIGINGGNITIGGVKVGVSSVMQGNVHYNLQKDAWYYSEYPDESGMVQLNNNYSNGAIYWVIRLDGTIKAGFRVKDITQQNNSSQNKVRSDAIAGIYKGSESLDFVNKFNSYSEMLNHVGSGKELEQLNGNNEKFNRNSDNIGIGYDKTDITDLSQLDGKKFVIANFHSHPAVVTNELGQKGNNTGLIGDKTISSLNGDAVMSSDALTEWTFEKTANGKYCIYSYIDGQKKYMSIRGESRNDSVELSDTLTELYINQNDEYAGKIRIANEHGMALNWCGANNTDTVFAGWTNGSLNDINDYQTLLEVKDDYKWCANSDTDNIGICFQKDMNLADDEALYIVVRTEPNYKPHGAQSNGLYKNGVASKQNSSPSSDWVPANTTEYILKTASAVYKDGKTSYMYDGNSWEYLAGEKNRLQYWKEESIKEPGIYAEWLINVNWDGSMQGLAEVSDNLPDYATPVYLREYWLAGAKPTYPEIPELMNDNNWVRKETYDIPFYYNPTSNEIRWRVDNLVKETDPLEVNSKTVNLQLICKINDPDVLLSGVTKNVDNTATVKNNGIVSKSVGTVPVEPKCSLQKRFAGNLTENSTTDSQLKFEIVVNPCGENIGNNDTLPPLIDEFTDNLRIIESSIEVKSADGKAITDYTYKIEYTPDNNKLIINKLPNGQKIIIKYEARTTSVADKDHDVKVSNKAYWSGYEPPEVPQVNSIVIKQSMSGSITLSHNPTVMIFKVDSENSVKRLSGAEFELYKQEEDEFVETGVTDNNGMLSFGKGTTFLEYDTVYYIKEKTAPDGYKLSDEKHYFIILRDKTIDNFSDIPGNTDIWYSKILGAEYECTITNRKQTISVNKTFVNEENESITPSGKFIFGIFDKNPENHHQEKPLQILEIEYINGEPQYKLDGVPCDTNEFTVAEPNEIYYVFELDELQNPISNETYMNANGQTYKVRYTSERHDRNMVTIALNEVNIENQIIYFSLPETGGIGLKKYYLFAGLISIIFLLTATRLYYVRRKSL